MAETYECALCQGVFEKVQDETWNDEMALQETMMEFPGPYDDLATLCDDCWKKVMPSARQ